MKILTIRTDKPEAEIGLYNNELQLAYRTWSAHKQLAETIHIQIRELLDAQTVDLRDLEAILVYKGPGSFTGLRIGISVANALSDGLKIPIIGSSDAWVEDGINRLLKGENDQLVMPEYGQLPHITLPRK